MLEPEVAPQTSAPKPATEMNLASQLTWKKVQREVEQTTWVPMENGREYTGELFVKRSSDSNLPKQVNWRASTP